MNTFTFEAKCVAVEHPDGVCHLVGFADSKFNTKTYFMLQRDFEGVSDEQEIELGMDNYHIEWCGQENSGYGGVSQFVLSQGGAEIAFALDGVENLNGMERLSISFQLTSSEYATLQEALGHIFRGSGCLVVASASQETRT
ncbi:MAG: hypothetical protein LBQ20_00660 [Rhodanobacter sp.]|jgi:hypothetical protein|nr:hypothetical protein [Rhodanobacter sp.]